MKEVLQFFKDNPTYFLATMEAQQPRVRPFGAVMEYEGKLYMITGKSKGVYRQMQQNPAIEVCGMSADGAWLRVAAKAVFDESLAAKSAMLEANPSLKSLYSANDDNIAVFYLEGATAVFASFTAPPRTIRF